MLPFYICIALFICANYVSCDETSEEDPNEMKYDQHAATLTKALFKNYNYLVRPCGQNSPENECNPVDVTVNMKILSITSIDDEKMHFNMQFLLRQEWNDQRLTHSGKTDLVLESANPQSRIWTPDTYFLQEKDSYKSLTDQPHNQYLIAPNGNVYYSTRVSITLSCPMDLRRYPFDVQYCEVQFGSYAQTKDQVHYKWHENRAVELAADVRHTTPTFTLGDVRRKDCKHQWVTGAYSCLKAEIEFKRQFGFGALMKSFIPSFVLVVLSWLAFYLGTDTLGVRALLGAGCLQFLLVHWSILSLNLPHVAGYRAIDVWFIGCIIFVLLSILELILVIRCPGKKSSAGDMEMVVLDRYMDEPPPQPKYSRTGSKAGSDTEAPRRAEAARRASVIKVQRKYTRIASSASPMPAPIKESMVAPMIPTSQYYEQPSAPPKKPSMMSRFHKLSGREKVDVVARFLFPVLFIIFNFAYWGSY